MMMWKLGVVWCERSSVILFEATSWLFLMIVIVLYRCLIRLSWCEENMIGMFVVVYLVSMLFNMFMLIGLSFENGLLSISSDGLWTSVVVSCICCWLLSESCSMWFLVRLIRFSCSIYCDVVVLVFLMLCSEARYSSCCWIGIFGYSLCFFGM